MNVAGRISNAFIMSIFCEINLHNFDEKIENFEKEFKQKFKQELQEEFKKNSQEEFKQQYKEESYQKVDRSIGRKFNDELARYFQKKFDERFQEEYSGELKEEYSGELKERLEGRLKNIDNNKDIDCEMYLCDIRKHLSLKLYLIFKILQLEPDIKNIDELNVDTLSHENQKKFYALKALKGQILMANSLEALYNLKFTDEKYQKIGQDMLDRGKSLVFPHDYKNAIERYNGLDDSGWIRNDNGHKGDTGAERKYRFAKDTDYFVKAMLIEDQFKKDMGYNFDVSIEEIYKKEYYSNDQKKIQVFNKFEGDSNLWIVNKVNPIKAEMEREREREREREMELNKLKEHLKGKICSFRILRFLFGLSDKENEKINKIGKAKDLKELETICDCSAGKILKGRTKKAFSEYVNANEKIKTLFPEEVNASAINK